MKPTTQAIIQAIELYSPIDNIEAAHKAAILDHFNQSANPMDSFCFEPGHATGSAWVMAKDTQEFALIYHKVLDRWLQPGGHAEPDEPDLLTVSLREAEEELGIKLDPTQATLLDLDVHRIPETKKYPSHLHFDFRYLCLTEIQPLHPATDADRAEWFTLDQLRTMQLDPGIERMIQKSIVQR
ncbi:NUDIX hydrolase [Pseudanabaenaceae cyanobacterium LEGE 13415]|nr:NUDIX hydrolase [Pseudanabaenaceae cyanobacterium LEGE 13415]